jgi:alpha-tubulin suppressor-like RCC1 family protein
MGGDGTLGPTTLLSPTLMFSLPSGSRIIQMAAATVAAYLDNAGRVFTWGANGNTNYLGRGVVGNNYATPIQVSGFDDSIRQIVGGSQCGMLALSKNDSLWGWGQNSGYLGNVSNSAYNSPHNLGDSVKRYIENGTTRTKLLMIASNSNSFHAIANDSTLWGWGDNGMGTIGNGVQANLASPGGSSTPWFIDPSAVLVLKQTHPVQVTNRHNFIYIPTGCLFSFTQFALDATGQLYACGRNKGGVLPNGVIECTGDGGDLSSFYPDSWDVPYLTPVIPFAVTSTIQQTCEGCHTGAVTANCHSCGNTTSATSNAGPNQNITTVSTVLDGSASTSTGGKIVYYVWSQISGTASTIDVPSAIKPNISGLAPGVYTYNLFVKDQGFNTSNSTVTITVSTSIIPSYLGPFFPGTIFILH